ncbi:hypothetical protein L520_0728 [Bordetella bronchiseptica MBORD681]|nr:hypothetical protein L520_0728 [Bordetella bronchiseptica MBORD681]KDD07336.1 hypothetical protein L521_0932 [Bordetella bronchiseptica MBORD698]
MPARAAHGAMGACPRWDRHPCGCPRWDRHPCGCPRWDRRPCGFATRDIPRYSPVAPMPAGGQARPRGQFALSPTQARRAAAPAGHEAGGCAWTPTRTGAASRPFSRTT